MSTSINSQSNLAKIRAQQEAERKRREAAEAKRREEEARKKAEAEAKKKAEEKAKQEAAKKAEQAEKAEKAEKAKKTAKPEETAPSQKGAAEKLAETGIKKGIDKTIKKPAEPISPEDAKVEHKGIKEDLKKVKTPEDMKKVADKSKTLEERLKVTEDPRVDKEMRKEIKATTSEVKKANDAVTKLESSKKALEEGSPEEKANETAKLLGNPEEFQGAVKDLAALKDSPIAKTLEKDVKGIAEKADAKNLAKQLDKEPDLSKYPPEMAKNVAKLTQVNDPDLKQSISKVATGILNKEGGVKLEDVQKNPEKGKILSVLQTSDDPKVKDKLASTVEGWAKDSLTSNLKGKEKKEGVDEAMKGFKKEMEALAKDTGLGATLKDAAPKAVDASKEKIEETAKKGDGFLDAVGGFFGNVFDGVKATVEGTTDLLGGTIGLVGDVANKAVDLVGDGLNFTQDTLGKGAEGLIKFGGNVLGEGLEAVGADELAKDVKQGSEIAGKVVGDYFDVQGDVLNSFADGVGAALKGTTDGLEFIIKEPVQAIQGVATLGKAVVTGDTDTLKAVGKALWDEASINPQTGKFDIAYAGGYIAANVVPMLMTGGGSTAATGANATSKMAQVTGKVSKFANRVDQVFNTAKSVSNMDFLGAIDNAKALKAPLQATDDVARLARTKAFVKNPGQYTKNYAAHIKGNVKVGTAQLNRNIKGFMEGAENIIRNPKQALGDFTTQLGKDAKKTQLTGKIAFKSAVRGLKTRNPAEFQKAVEFMNKNPLVQGINNGLTRANSLMETIKNPLSPLTSRMEGAVNNAFNNNFTGVGQRIQEGMFDTLQTTAQQEELKDAPKKSEPKKEPATP